MIHEIATLSIQVGQEAAFETAFAQAAPLFLRAKGCGGVELQRCLEDPLSYRLLVKWQTLENHTIDFRNSVDFQSWRSLVAHYFSAPPQVIHARSLVAAH